MKKVLFLFVLSFVFIACEIERSSSTKMLMIHNATDKIVYMETTRIDGEFLSQAILPDSMGYAMRHLLYPYKNSKTEINKLIPINIYYDEKWYFVDGTDSLSWMYRDNYIDANIVVDHAEVFVYELTEDFILSLRRLDR